MDSKGVLDAVVCGLQSVHHVQSHFFSWFAFSLLMPAYLMLRLIESDCLHHEKVFMSLICWFGSWNKSKLPVWFSAGVAPFSLLFTRRKKKILNCAFWIIFFSFYNLTLKIRLTGTTLKVSVATSAFGCNPLGVCTPCARWLDGFGHLSLVVMSILCHGLPPGHFGI